MSRNDPDTAPFKPGEIAEREAIRLLRGRGFTITKTIDVTMAVVPNQPTPPQAGEREAFEKAALICDKIRDGYGPPVSFDISYGVADECARAIREAAFARAAAPAAPAGGLSAKAWDIGEALADAKLLTDDATPQQVLKALAPVLARLDPDSRKLCPHCSGILRPGCCQGGF